MAQQLFLQRYKDPKYVGNGAFGLVASVSVLDTTTNQNEHRAMKLVESDDRTAMNEVKQLCPSFRQHQNLIRYFDTWILNTETLSREWNSVLQVKYRQGLPRLMFAIELELCEVDLAKVLTERNKFDTANIPRSTHDSLINCIKDVSNGLKFLHDQKLVHRDIKPANILRHESGTWKISDLGLARLVDTTMTPKAGTPFYFAPEQGTQNYDCKVDIFSFGLVIFEICYRMIYFVNGKFDQCHHYQCFRGLRSPKFKFPPENTERFDTYPKTLNDLIRRMLDKEAKNRASIDDVINDLKQSKIL